MLNLYWEYAGTRYRSKFRALDAANGNYKGITFRIHESEDFDNYTWSIEPTPSLKELQKQRALQLRDSYPYLKLWFSGGADSTTVLNTFLDNKARFQYGSRASQGRSGACRTKGSPFSGKLPGFSTLQIGVPWREVS